MHDVLDYLASAMTAAEFVADFPELSELHLRAALEFAGLRERRLAAPAWATCNQIAAASPRRSA